MTRDLTNSSAETKYNAEEEEFVKSLAPQYRCSAVQLRRWAIRFVLDNVSHNDFATYIAQQQDATDKRRYDEKDEQARANGKDV